MRIGDLSKRIDIQASTKISDGAGGFSTTFVTIATVFCAIWPVSASEQVKNMGVTMTISHRVRIRYRSILKASYRIVYAGRNFNIVSIIDPNMSHEYLDILCKEAA